MSLQDELTAAQRCLDDLARSVARLEERVGTGLEIRRVRSDTEHLKESLSLLRAAAPRPPAEPRVEMVTIPEQPYDAGLWTDVDDEGLGAQDRHAP
ncbi:MULTISPECIES: hypothetical protein [unclassified Streptomyces]|uniref:hypothetical protein n=1 Tax=unclassified Streptomyces TaxID=2593676 RepID=UPI002DDB4F7F|nr:MULTISPECIES: hypothetical protein [unclassified Streptomyces]WSA92565.1 hypothetical protein OIE63_14075 [Streptomyces sp. NBC_01795]WSB76932.1 hypothetical protein OHB04_14880 [Streptomyces sp. NBC_01775]WSS14795.1 hypothetical protein OG533_25065 [Streptomyces sp. NBC_01186]WSS43629.1 hypothetical protein OG220_25830 [Streptomyces sp. NBC_01187]